MTEWHTIGAYRVSFDVRRDASRFVIVNARDKIFVASGLVDADRVLFDQDVSVRIAAIGAVMQSRWFEMRARLRAGTP